MENDNDKNFKKSPAVFSKTIRAGKRRTYFFDVRTTKANDYYITLTESKKKFNDDGYDRHKIFLYKEDFNKFIEALNETVNHVKEDLLPEYDFDEFSNNYEDDSEDNDNPYNFDDEGERESNSTYREENTVEESNTPVPGQNLSTDEDDLKWD